MAASRRFRFGVQYNGQTLDGWLETARKAEDLGFDILMSSDHFGRQMSPLLALTAVATATTGLRAGTIVLDNDFRHPAVLAKEAATLDVLSKGRFELGLGAGWSLDDYTKSGISFDPPPVRMQRLRETVDVCRAFFSDAESVTYDGTYTHIAGLDAYPRPVQPNGPPIMVGGRQKRMLSLAARIADIVSISLLDRSRAPDDTGPPPSFEDKLAWIRTAAGERYEHLELQINAFALEVTDDATAALARIAERAGVTPEQALQSPANIVGSLDGVCEQLEAWRARGDVSYFNVPAARMENIAPVVARLAGK